jgi:hypothetical protein
VQSYQRHDILRLESAGLVLIDHAGCHLQATTVHITRKTRPSQNLQWEQPEGWRQESSTNGQIIDTHQRTSLAEWTRAWACGRNLGRACAQSCSTYSRHVLFGLKSAIRLRGLYCGTSKMSCACLTARLATILPVPPLLPLTPRPIAEAVSATSAFSCRRDMQSEPLHRLLACISWPVA